MVIPNLVKQALSGADMTVYGDGTQSRCFTHVNDAIRALIGLMDSAQTQGEVYNVGSTEEISVLELAWKIKELTASPSKIVFIPYVEAYEAGFEDMMRRVPDLTKIGRLLGYAPKVTLDETLLDITKYHAEQMIHVQNGYNKTVSVAAGRA